MFKRILLGAAVGLVVYAALPKQAPKTRKPGQISPPPLVPPGGSGGPVARR